MDFFELAKRKTQERLQAKLASQSKPTPPPSPDLQNEERETTSRPIAEPAKVIVADAVPTQPTEPAKVVVTDPIPTRPIETREVVSADQPQPNERRRQATPNPTARPIAEPAKVVVSADPIPTTQSERTAKFDSIEQAPQSALFRRTDKPSNIGNFPKCLSYTFEGLIQHLCRICFKDLWIRDRETAKQNALQAAKQLYKDNYIDFYLP